MPAPLHIAFLLFPNVTQLDLVGKTLDPVPTDAGFSILPTATFDTVPRADA